MNLYTYNDNRMGRNISLFEISVTPKAASGARLAERNSFEIHEIILMEFRERGIPLKAHSIECPANLISLEAARTF